MTRPPVHEMFRQAAAAFPGHIAIDSGEDRVTYRELSARVAGLTSAITAAGAREDLVVILSDRTANVIAAMLAVLEAGCAFVPLDPGFPLANLPWVVAEIRPRVWLADPERVAPLERLLEEQGLEATVIPLGSATSAEAGPATAVERDPDGLCYVYFTSGSTGRPKGISGRLKAIDHFIRWEIGAFGVGEGTRVSQLTSPAFDAFLRDAFTPLAAGGTVCVPPSREILFNGEGLAGWIDRERVELLHCTPSVFRLLLAQELRPERFPSLRYVLLAGEQLLPADVRTWYGVFGNRIQLVNLYGPSETTMIKLFYPVQPEDANARLIPVGKPMPETQAIVVDDDGQPCPPGKLGEIYIRTPYRALGYFNQPELTGEAFVQNPWSDRPGDLVYKTGDLGRLRENGDFEVLGRRDQQVKIRGVRVEIAPIEDLLRSHPDVADAVVVDRSDTQGNKFLCAYLVMRLDVETSVLASHLRASLPEVMVPSAFVVMEALPRTLSGKVDRRSLPSPGEFERRRRAYVAPRTPVEETLCRLYSEMLGVPRIGIHDSFFELGGHSLLVTQLLDRVRAELVPVPLGQIFRTPTVEELALVITRMQLEQAEAQAAEDLLDEIEGLSEEALDELLRSEDRAPVGEGEPA